MVLKLQATQYFGRAQTGRSRPLQCMCSDDEGSEFAAFLKGENFHEDLVPCHLAGELIANLFAIDLGLPAASPAVVTIHQEFIELLPHDADGDALRAAISRLPADLFGSIQFERVRRWSPKDLVHKNQRAAAAKLYLFDTLVENTDRGNGNPNLLMSGFDFKVIDFGHCFQRCHAEENEASPLKPWQWGGISNHFAGTMQHIMLDAAKRAGSDEVDAFKTALLRLSDDTIEGYAAQVPREWGEDAILRMVSYLLEARDNADSFAANVKGVLGFS